MIGEKLGPFRIDSVLGSGAMGVVYRATFEQTGQVVAIKVIPQELAAKGNAADRFSRESDILKQFRHPNIVRHIGVGYSKNKCVSYYAMECVPGQTLEQVLKEQGPFGWLDVVRIGIQVCDALHYAHQRAVIHRDLKPSNLMITEDGQIKLTDFGIAKDLDRTALTADGRTLGTAAYMAPEQIRGTPEVSHKTDLYALGCVLYQLLTGRTPYEGNTALVLMHQHLDAPIPRPSAREPAIPKALDNLIVALMMKNPSERPWDALAVHQVLTDLLEKADRGEPIGMVFGPAPVNPPRAGVATVPSGTNGTGSSTAVKLKKVKSKRRKGRVAQRSPMFWLETGGLVAAFLGIAALMGYLLWPPSQAYLYERARRGMAAAIAAEDREAMAAIERDYLDPLTRRFPQNPYKAEIRVWRDHLLGEEAEDRAALLERGLSKPRLDAEEAYLDVHRETNEMLREEPADRPIRDQDALGRWKELGRVLDVEDRERRKWHVMAQRRAESLQNQIKSRDDRFARLLAEVNIAAESGRLQEALERLERAILQFGRYQSLAPRLQYARHRQAELLARAGVAPEVEPVEKPDPPATPDVPGA